METLVLVPLIATITLAGSAAIGGSIAHIKKRQPLEGFTLGLLLGPVGVVIEAFLPVWTRPMVDRNAWNSFNSLVTYQNTEAGKARLRSSRRGIRSGSI